HPNDFAAVVLDTKRDQVAAWTRSSQALTNRRSKPYAAGSKPRVGRRLKSQDDLKIVFDQAGRAEAQLVRDRLDMYNVGGTGLSGYYPVHFFVRSARSETLGGLLGGIWGGWLHISYLWVDEAVRGRRWASTLMDQAEAYARERGCHWVSLDTHSFQARPFYEKRG